MYPCEFSRYPKSSIMTFDEERSLREAVALRRKRAYAKMQSGQIAHWQVPTSRFDSPSFRIDHVLSRLSRERYLSPFELYDMALKLAGHTFSGRPTITARNAVPYGGAAVGIYKGEPLLEQGTVAFRDAAWFLSGVHSRRVRVSKHDLLIELLTVICGGKRCLTKLKKSVPLATRAS